MALQIGRLCPCAVGCGLVTWPPVAMTTCNCGHVTTWPPIASNFQAIGRGNNPGPDGHIHTRTSRGRISPIILLAMCCNEPRNFFKNSNRLNLPREQAAPQVLLLGDVHPSWASVFRNSQSMHRGRDIVGVLWLETRPWLSMNLNSNIHWGIDCIRA